MKTKKHMKKRASLSLAAALLCIFFAVSACAAPGEGENAPAAREGTNGSSAVTAETAASDTETPAEAGNQGEAGSESAANAGELPQDGTYEPAVFTFQGGSGKVSITCPEVVIEGGVARALIEMSSPHYEWVKVDGVQYDPENAGEKDRKNSIFRIPVVLDQEMTISALTTAMSQPHEIEYTLLISLAQEGAAAAGSSVEEMRTGDEARVSEPPRIEGLSFVSAMDTAYAQNFDIYTYEPTDGGPEDLFRLIDVHGSALYLILPESAGSSGAYEDLIPQIPDTITVLQAPLDRLYVAATSSMALFDAAGAIGQVKLTGTKAEDWYIDAPKKALEDGSMVYAGKYSAPDYELLTSSGCDLAVESMMILHTPEVKEKLEELGIPVLIDTSSNESHPMGRTEWVRLYGVLTGHEEEADAFWDRQKEEFAKADAYEKTGLTVAFFSISSSGNVIVRAADDYIPRMIELAGGEYIFSNLVNGSGNSASVRLSMEEFYNTAGEADYLIYNATIESPVQNIEELCAKSALLRDFKAVQEGRVFQVRRNLYQSPDIAARMIIDLHGMLTGGAAEEMTFLEQLKKKKKNCLWITRRAQIPRARERFELHAISQCLPRLRRHSWL